MKKNMIIGAFIVSASLLAAQTAEKPVTVRIKKVENINGVEKISDSTYTVNDVSDLIPIDGAKIIKSDCKKDGATRQIVIVTDQGNGEEATGIDKNGEIDKQIQKALKDAGVEGKATGLDKMVFVSVDEKELNDKGGKNITKIVIIKKIQIVEPSEAEAKMIGKETGLSEGQLKLNDMKFYPNPNNGKFNLSFALPEKGATEVNIMNMEGKSVYNEHLTEFSGNYTKEIDISANPKGAYFVKVKQGGRSRLKKIVLE